MSIRNYKLTENKKLFYLGLGFLFIALAEIATILTKFVIYYKTTLFQVVGGVVLKYDILKASDISYDLGFFLYKFLTLAGLYVIYRLPLNDKNIGDIVLAGFFILLSSLAGQFIFFIFHLTVLLFLVLIIDTYLKVYKKNKSCKTKLLLIAFSILTASHLIFLLQGLPQLYIIGQIMQLISYLTLLVLVIKINKNENSKRK